MESVQEETRDTDEATASQVRQSTLLLVGRVLSLLGNLAFHVLAARYLSTSDFGAFAYALSFNATARILVTLGHNRTITRFLAIYEEERAYHKLFGTLAMETGIILATSAVLFFGLLGFRDALSPALIDDPQAVSVLAILVLLAPLEALDDLVEGMLAVFSKPGAIFVRRYVVAPLLRLAVVALLIASDSGVMFLAGGYVAASAAGVLLYSSLLVTVLRERGFLAHLRMRQLSMPFKEVFSFSLPLLSTDLVVISMNTVSVFLLGFFSGASGTRAVGAFRVILPAAVLNQFVMRTFTLLFTPLASRLYARDDAEGMREAYWQTAVWLAVCTFPIFALTFVFSEPLTVTLFGERYRDSAPYLAILACGYYFNVSLGFNALILQIFGRVRYLLTVNVIAAIANIVLSVALIAPFGALGVAIANASTLVLQNLLNQAGLGRGIGIDLLPGRYLRVYAAVLAATAALWALNYTLAPDPLLCLAATAVAALGVLAANRGLMRIGQTYPLLLKVPVVRRLLD